MLIYMKFEYSNGGNVIRYTDGDTRKQKHGLHKSCVLFSFILLTPCQCLCSNVFQFKHKRQNPDY